MPEKPRSLIPDLGDTPQLRPQARGVDAYVRPGQVEYGKPAATNPFLQLSSALANMQPTLNSAASAVASQYSEAEYAKGEADYYANRDVVNSHIKSGQFPEGASPYYVKAAQRASLRQLGAEFQTSMKEAYFGEAGALARNTDNPAEVTGFISTLREQFAKQHLQNGDKKLFSDLDIHEVFNPLAEHAYSSLQATHANHRVAEREAQAEATAGASITAVMSMNGHSTKRNEYASESLYEKQVQTMATSIKAIFDDPKDGLRTNGMLSTVRVEVGGQQLTIAKSSKLMVDTVVANAIKFDNPDLLDVLGQIENKGKGKLGDTQYAVSHIQTAREHIMSQRIQNERNAEHKADRPFHEASMQHTVQEWARQDERYGRELKEVDRSDRAHAQKSIDTIYEKRVFDVLRRPDGLKLADRELTIMEREASPEASLRIRELIHTVTKQRAEFINSPANDLHAAKLRLEISNDPLSFDRTKLYTALANGRINKGTFDQYMDDWERGAQHGDHPFMRQGTFRDMMTDVGKGTVTKDGNEFGLDATMRKSSAQGAFRDYANAWIEEHPKGTASQFNSYMRDKIGGVIESSSPELKQAGEEGRKQKAQAEQDQKYGPVQPGMDEANKNIAEIQQTLKRIQEQFGGKPQASPPPPESQPLTAPSSKAVNALLGAPTQTNIDAFVKRFGESALPEKLKKTKP